MLMKMNLTSQILDCWMSDRMWHLVFQLSSLAVSVSVGSCKYPEL